MTTLSGISFLFHDRVQPCFSCISSTTIKKVAYTFASGIALNCGMLLALQYFKISLPITLVNQWKMNIIPSCLAYASMEGLHDVTSYLFPTSSPMIYITQKIVCLVFCSMVMNLFFPFYSITLLDLCFVYLLTPTSQEDSSETALT